MQTTANYLFEVSWEVCNKVGGIHTVLESKADLMMRAYENYFLIGPYFGNAARLEFFSCDIPQEFKEVIVELAQEGITVHFGRWDSVKDKPYVFLIDCTNIFSQKNTIKRMYWDDYQIDSLRGAWDFEEPLIWGYAVGILIERLKRKALMQHTVVAHFHEWLAGAAALYLKKHCPAVACVMTTHATVLGRCLAGNGRDFYHSLETIDPLREAYQYSVEAKHLLESAAARNVDIFTTVSPITALESEKFLGRKPEILVLNGLDVAAFPDYEALAEKHHATSEKIKEFLAYYFFPYYPFDLEYSKIFYTLGRFEYRNKGYDILIDALAQLNEQLKKDAREKKQSALAAARTLVFIFWVPLATAGHNIDLLENKNYYMHIKNHLETNAPEILKRLLYDLVSRSSGNATNTTANTPVTIAVKSSAAKNPNGPDGITSDAVQYTARFIHDITRDLRLFERAGNPPLSTHNIRDAGQNPLITALVTHGLLNRPEDRVKVVVEPVYLDGSDGFIDLGYYDAMAGCDLGVFPSYYEPWGYTPLESAAVGVPAITTDLSGFGMYMKDKMPLQQSPSSLSTPRGITILDRFQKSAAECTAQLVHELHAHLFYDHAQQIESRLDAKRAVLVADWKVLIDNYIAAHNRAVDQAKRISA